MDHSGHEGRTRDLQYSVFSRGDKRLIEEKKDKTKI